MIHAKRTTLPLSRIRATHQVHRAHVEEIASSTRAKPPILVIEAKRGSTYHLLDGHHRVAAARKAGRKTIQAYVVPRSAYTHPHIDYYAPGKVAPMSLDDTIVVTWRGRRRKYEDMRGDGKFSPINRARLRALVRHGHAWLFEAST